MCIINEYHMLYISWDMSVIDITFSHFWLFYALLHLKFWKNFEKMKKVPVDIIILHMCAINENQIMYVSWDMERGRHNFFLILDHFLPFYPPFLPTNNSENQNFEKMKKKPWPGMIIISHKCSINENHMMYDSWNMNRDRQNFLSFWAIF